MSRAEEIKSNFLDAVKNVSKTRTEGYDTTATVVSVEDGIAWVQIPGGVRETPVDLSVDAKEGDTVQVRVSGGRAWLVGNNSSPPTDDTQANHATTIAEQAQTEIAEQKEFFYHDENGAHVRGEAYRNDIKSDGMSIVENSTDNLVAKFGAALIELGKNAVSSIISMCADKVKVKASNLSASIEADGTGSGATGGVMTLSLLARNTINDASREAEVMLYSSADNDSTEIYLNADTVDVRTDDLRMLSGKVIPQTGVTTWTAPTITSSRCTIGAGGYFAEGKHVYIQMSLNLASSLAANTALQIFEGMPAPRSVNAVLSVLFSNNGGGGAYISTSGNVIIKTPASVSAATSTNIFLSGHYVTA